MESEFIAHLRRRIPPHPLVRLGPGDDAAVLRMAGCAECVVTTDLLMDQVDFELAGIDPRRAGRKALAASLSDLAAMASRPLAGVVSLALPRAGGMDLAVALYEGLLPLAQRYRVAIAGGDTNSWDGPLVISVTLLGAVTPRGPLCRSGARPGDWIVVTGAFGGSILGKHLDFEPRVDEALLLAERYQLHAGIDASDGLSLDLSHLAVESRCGALVDLPSVPVAEDAHRLAAKLADGSTALDHALGDGEDFELILAVPPGEAERMLAEQPLLGKGDRSNLCEAPSGPLRQIGPVPFSPVPLTRVGQFIAEPGLWQDDGRGGRTPLTARGYEHSFD